MNTDQNSNPAGSCPCDCGHTPEQHEAHDLGRDAGERLGMKADNPFTLPHLRAAWQSGHSVGALNHANRKAYDVAAHRGHMDGILSQPITENPYPEGSAEAIGWRSGWLIGDADNRQLGRGLPALMEAVTEWADRQFPMQETLSKIVHMAKEVEELKANPTDGEEMADVLLLLCQVASRARVDLLATAWRKLEKNKARQWGEPDADGVVHHIPDTEAQRLKKVPLLSESTAWTQEEVVAYQRGFVAGTDIAPQTNPYPVNSILSKFWERGYDNGIFESL